MLADGGEAIADLAVLRDQKEVFGPVASTPTTRHWLACARAQARNATLWDSPSSSSTRLGTVPGLASPKQSGKW
jgi:glycine cleavage system aminomethyltransferase T